MVIVLAFYFLLQAADYPFGIFKLILAQSEGTTIFWNNLYQIRSIYFFKRWKVNITLAKQGSKIYSVRMIKRVLKPQRKKEKQNKTKSKKIYQASLKTTKNKNKAKNNFVLLKFTVPQ